MDKRFITILAALVIIFGGVFLISRHDNGSSGSDQASNHITGQGQAGVRLVEYGDYQCPVCQTFNSIVEQVKKKFSQQIIYQFRNLPLYQSHPNATAAARAAEAAGLQGKYWPMHDELYKLNNWQNWTNASNPNSLFESYAQQIGLNVSQFKQDYSSAKVNDTINADVAEFNKTGHELATPTFFLDGTALDNNTIVTFDLSTGALNPKQSLKKFSAVIQAEIDKQTAKH